MQAQNVNSKILFPLMQRFAEHREGLEGWQGKEISGLELMASTKHYFIYPDYVFAIETPPCTRSNIRSTKRARMLWYQGLPPNHGVGRYGLLERGVEGHLKAALRAASLNRCDAECFKSKCSTRKCRWPTGPTFSAAC